MTEEEWLNGLRHLTDQQKLDVHFGLQEQIKKHYKLREDPKHLKKAVELCKQQIAFAPLALPALKSAHEQRVSDYLNHLNKPHPHPEFTPPSHQGYRQYAIILRKQKDFDTLEKIQAKKISEGWA